VLGVTLGDGQQTGYVWPVKSVVWLGLVALFGCMPEPPARWAEGGSPLLLPDARWDRGQSDPIIIRRDGHVLQGDDLLFMLDAAGRVFDEDNEPVALLNDDGSIGGPDEVYLGRIGMQNASPPWSSTAWLRVRADGKVALYDSDGEAQYGGKWVGCEVPKTRACTLVTHLLALQAARRRQENDVQVGVGIGVMF
jgi:hypothetical protein